MKRLKKWLGICEHDWREIAQYAINIIHLNGTKSQVNTEYHQQCSKCKKMRKFTL